MKRSQEALKHRDHQAELSALTVPELRSLARELGIEISNSLKKSELISRILKQSAPAKGETGDWLNVREVAPFWLGIEWKVSPELVRRAAAALGSAWHQSTRVLRIYRVNWDESGPHAREHLRDVPLPEEATQWFVEIDGESRGWKLELGQAGPGGKFFSLLHSHDLEVAPPAQRRHSQPSESPQQTVPSSSLTTEPEFSVTGEVIIQGKTLPGTNISVDDEHLRVHAKTGHFHWKTPLVHGRTIVPILAESGQQRLRAIISLEANIHYLEREKLNVT